MSSSARLGPPAFRDGEPPDDGRLTIRQCQPPCRIVRRTPKPPGQTSRAHAEVAHCRTALGSSCEELAGRLGTSSRSGNFGGLAFSGDSPLVARWRKSARDGSDFSRGELDQLAQELPGDRAVLRALVELLEKKAAGTPSAAREQELEGRRAELEAAVADASGDDTWKAGPPPDDEGRDPRTREWRGTSRAADAREAASLTNTGPKRGDAP